MKRVNIYIAVNSANTRKSKKRYGYILECEIGGAAYTREGFGECEETYHGATLRALNGALERINQTCEVHIHTENTFVLNMMEKNLGKWAGNEFRTSKGKPLENQEEWMQLWQQFVKHLMVEEPGRHAFSNWLQELMADNKRFEEKMEKAHG